MFAVLPLLAALQQQPYPPVRRPGADPDAERQLKALCQVPDTADGGALLHREFKAGLVAPRSGAPADAWTTLGCIRVRLWFTSVLPREGTHMPLGYTWDRGALNAMLMAAAKHPGDSRAAEVAALLALWEQEPLRQKEILATLKSVIRAGVATRGVLRACAEFGLRFHEDTLARGCAERGLVLGADSTWHYLRLARLSLHSADTAACAADFVEAAAAARTEADLQEINWHLQWFLAPAEVRQWRTILPAERGAWVKDRIASRDVRDGQPPGSRLMAHFARLEFVLEHFWTRVPKAMANLIRQRGTPVNTIGLHYSGPGLTGGMKASGSAGAAGRWQIEFDDRGVVYMRLGPPTTRYYWGYDFARELWTYVIDGKTYFLHFQDEDYNGSKEATRLVSGVVDPFFCGIDPIRCEASAYVFTRPPENLMATVRAQDREALAVGTMGDDNSVRDVRNVLMVSQLLRLWNPVDRQPASLIVYAMRATDLVLDRDPAGLTTTVTLRFRQWSPILGEERDTSLTRRLRLPVDTVTNRSWVSGFLNTATSKGPITWSLVTTQSDGRRGRVFQDNQQGLSEAPLAISDIVLGAPGQGLVFDQFLRPIVLAPLGAFNRQQPINLYYQLKAGAPYRDLRTSLILFQRTASGVDSAQVLQLSFTSEAIVEGINEIEREVDISRFAPGTYHLEIRVSDPVSGALVSRSAVLNIY